MQLCQHAALKVSGTLTCAEQGEVDPIATASSCAACAVSIYAPATQLGSRRRSSTRRRSSFRLQLLSLSDDGRDGGVDCLVHGNVLFSKELSVPSLGSAWSQSTGARDHSLSSRRRIRPLKGSLTVGSALRTFRGFKHP